MFCVSKIFFFLAAVFFPLFFMGQEKEQNTAGGFNPIGEQDVQLLYKNDFSFSVFAHTNGFGLNFRRGRHITGFKRGIFELEIASYKHPKEVRTVNERFDHSKGYFYGKLNVVHMIRPGVGTYFQLFGKQQRRGVEVNLVTFLAASFAMAKPVYLQILKPDPTGLPNEYIVSTEKYDPELHRKEDIYGREPYFKGFGEIKAYVGANAKLGLNFEHADLDDEIRSLETGVCFDLYPKVIPIMANEHNRSAYVTFYLSFTWGRRWF
ncbi:MAG: hypothetical protein IT233_01025 [Bacteroidia bacterium]|nr:hypothetical protein [Bacteroidia bacterium]